MNNGIAVFDSGVGGLTALKQLKSILPYEDFNYFADNLHAPYGAKSSEEIADLTFAAMDRITAAKPKAVVIACNTATGVCIDRLRERYADTIIFGIQPAVGPAVKPSLVFLTPAAANSEGFKKFAKDKKDIFVFPLEHAARFIENNISDEMFASYLSKELEGLDLAKFSSAVLGCTHYVFKKEVFRKVSGLPVFDGNEGLARHVKKTLADRGLLDKGNVPGSVFFNLSDCQTAEYQKYLSLFNSYACL